MDYLFAAHTDKGIRKSTNQDSICIKQAKTSKGNILFAVICDGMGGLDKGELASSTIISDAADWFENSLPYLLVQNNVSDKISYEMKRFVSEQNVKIRLYGEENHIQLGSTLSSIIILEDGNFIVTHVGDCRIYRISNNEITQLTQDQTLVAYEVKRGKITAEQAKTDSRQNVLLQCIGASKTVNPDVFTGKATAEECYLICSDGFRHKLSNSDFLSAFAPSVNNSEQQMKAHLVNLIEEDKRRQETDNISALLIKIK